MILRLILICTLYSLWVYYTRNVRFQSEHWGPTWLVALLRRILTTIINGLGVRSTLTVEVPETIDKSKRFVIASSPHGVCGFAGITLGMPQMRTSETHQSLNITIVGATVVFFVPVLREFLMLVGVRDASRSNVQHLIKAGHSILLNPGGIYEQVSTDHTREVVFCQAGLGFIKIAMQHGLDIIPCYSFGENQVFTAHTLLQRFRLWVVDTYRVGLPLFTGRWGLPPPLALPLPTHVHTVFGRPVQVGKATPTPSDEQVDAVFKAYEVEMLRLFDAHKHFLPSAVAAKGLQVVRRKRRPKAECIFTELDS